MLKEYVEFSHNLLNNGNERKITEAIESERLDG